MNELLLSRRLGLASPQAFQRAQYERLLLALAPNERVRFDRQGGQADVQSRGSPLASTRHSLAIAAARQKPPVAHNSGVNVLAVDDQVGKHLISGGADAVIRVWDLEDHGLNRPYFLHPVASTTPSRVGSHTHALTSLSIYPFDPTPSTAFTTSFDKTLKIFALDAANITSVHSFDLIDTPYSHSLSPIASSASLIAVGTAHPAVRLLDLRSGLATHALPGHSGAVFSVCWSPISEHLLASSSADGRVLFFDVRRAHSAFASLDIDDALGVLRHDVSPDYTPRAALDWSSKAHNGPVTGVRWFDAGRKLVTCGHDQRIRVWDATTGRNDLVHFGPRIRNQRNGEFSPLISPTSCGSRSSGSHPQPIFWPNDDAKGEILVMDPRDGTTLNVLRTPGTTRNNTPAINSAAGRSRQTSTSTQTTTITSNGRINSLAWRSQAISGPALELYSAHGDGSIHVWTYDGASSDEEDEEDDDQKQLNAETDARQEKRQKRKRDLLDGIVEGLVRVGGSASESLPKY